jgi:hypothetical protein
MICRKRSLAGVAFLLALVLLTSAETLNAGDADLDSHTFAVAQSTKQKCMNTCRARYRDCVSKRHIPSFECQGIYQDCARFTCKAVRG